MPIQLEVTSGSGGLRPSLTAGYPKATVPKMTFLVSLYKDKTWTVRRPLPEQWRYIMPNYPTGYWYKDAAGTFVMMDQSNQYTVFELRTIEKGEGPAFHWPKQSDHFLGGTHYEGEGWWKPSPIPSQKMWAGVMAKGAGGLVVGCEGALAAITNVDQKRSGGVLKMGTLRAGAVGGASGGAALVICIGFNSIEEMHRFSSSGADFTIAIGAKASGLIKASKLATTLKSFEGGLEMVEQALALGQESKVTQKLLNESPGLAKSVTSAYGMVIDTDARNIIAIDIPLASYGAELGVFWGWSKTWVVKSW